MAGIIAERKRQRQTSDFRLQAQQKKKKKKNGIPQPPRQARDLRQCWGLQK